MKACLIHTLLCLAALNLAFWETALSLHRIHDHQTRPGPEIPLLADEDHIHHHDGHGACPVCDLFTRYVLKGLLCNRLDPVPDLVAVKADLSFRSQACPGPVHGFLVRAPPVS